jgi:hypothetical protein
MSLASARKDYFSFLHGLFIKQMHHGAINAM